MLRENADDRGLEVLVLALLLVLAAEEDERKHGEQQVNHVVELTAHLPSGELTAVSLRLEVVSAAVQPVTVAVHLQLVEVLELVEGMMLQVVRLCHQLDLRNTY